MIPQRVKQFYMNVTDIMKKEDKTILYERNRYYEKRGL